MVGHGGSSAGLYLADPTSPIPSHCASIVATSTVRVTHCGTEQSGSIIEQSFSFSPCGVTSWYSPQHWVAAFVGPEAKAYIHGEIVRYCFTSILIRSAL